MCNCKEQSLVCSIKRKHIKILLKERKIEGESAWLPTFKWKTIQLKVKAADREDAIRKAAACLVEEKN